MKKYTKVCRKHSDCIIYHNSDDECPLCVAEKELDDLTEMLDGAEDKLETATAGAPGSY